MYLESLKECNNERQEAAQSPKMIVDFTNSQDARENPGKLSTHTTIENTKNDSDDISFEEFNARQQESSQLSKQLDDINSCLIEQLEKAGRAVLQTEFESNNVDERSSFSNPIKDGTYIITKGRQGNTIVVSHDMRRERHRRCIRHKILSCEACARCNTEDIFDDSEGVIDADLQRMMKIVKKSRKKAKRKRARWRARRARERQRQLQQLQQVADSMLPMVADESAV